MAVIRVPNATLPAPPPPQQKTGLYAASREVGSDSRDHVNRLAATSFLLAIAWGAFVQFLDWPVFLTPVFGSHAWVDSAVYSSAGELLRTGGIPYVSYWDHKPPLIHLINAGALALSGGHLWGVWVLNFCVLIATLTLAAHTLQRTVGTVPAILGLVYFAASLPAVYAANHTQTYCLPLQWLAIGILLQWADRPGREGRYGLLLGLLLGVQFLLQQNLIGASVTVALVISLLLLSEREWSACGQFIASAFAGFGLIAGACLGYLASQSALSAFWDQTFRYNFMYSASTWSARIRAAYSGMKMATLLGAFFIPLAGWLLAAYRLRTSKPSVRPVVLLAVVWPVIALTFACVSGRTYWNYFMVLVAPFSFLTAWLIKEIVSRMSPGQVTTMYPAVVALSCAMVISTALEIGWKVRDYGLRPVRMDQVPYTAAYLKEHLPSDSTILVWGYAPDLYHLSGLRPASRYLYALPLLTPRYADERVITDFLQEVRSNQPTVIVDATNSAGSTRGGEDAVPTLAAWNPAWRFPARGPIYWRMTPGLKEFYDYVAASYQLVDRVGPLQWTIYWRIQPGPDKEAGAVIRPMERNARPL